ncbi:MAG: UvrD-helicase domain-containing protein [Phycisphaerae bacterium]|jgi:DNA helicase-2/ATP-dependent DNA helicase PcrA
MLNNKRYAPLTESQQQAVFHTAGPLLVIAGPGSGKTRVITYRIAALIDSGVNPRNICAITFTNKAAEEMKSRAFELGASAGARISTFHSLCVRILRRYSDAAGIGTNFSIYSESEQNTAMKQAIKDCNLESSNFPPARMREAVSTLKNKLINAETFKNMADDYFSTSLSKIYSRYQHILKANNSVDFDDLLMQAAFLLEQSEAVRRELSNRFTYLLIDEYQDTNHAQYRIAKSLASAHSNICATGDPDQSIYRWRGADISNILAFEKDWPDALVIKLQENFRSTPQILLTADQLISANKARKLKSLIPTKQAGTEPKIIVCDDEQDEAEHLADEIKQLIDQGVSPKDIAIFYRINAASRPLEEAFIRSQTPYQIVRGVEFYNRKEIRDILAYLKAMTNPADEIALLRIINTPARGIGKTTVDRVLAYAAANKITFYKALENAKSINSINNSTKAKIAVFAEMLNKLKTEIQGPVAQVVQNVFANSGLESSLRQTGDKDALDNIDALIDAAAIFDKNTDQPALIDFLQQIALFSDADVYDGSNERVAMMTLHTAKGLEFDNVFIVGLEQGMLPHERSTNSDEELEEERRLFFVGITRAKLRLHISYAKYRTIHGRFMRTIPSQFLFEIGAKLEEYDGSENSEQDDKSQDNKYEYDDSTQVDAEFYPNQLIRHGKFGLGRITKFVSLGDNSTVTVRFNSGKTKTLMLKYADIETVDI